MSGYIPPTSEVDPCEPPPPYYSVVTESAAQDKAVSHPSALPGYAYLPQSAGTPQHQSGGYHGPPSYASQQGYPPSPGYPSQPRPYSPQSGYRSACTQQPGAYTAGPQLQRTVIVQQPSLASAVQQFRDAPVQTVCSKCQASVTTVTVFETGTLNWLFCAILFLIGCDAGCCLIPFCVDGCKDVVHVCPNCHHTITRSNRL